MSSGNKYHRTIFDLHGPTTVKVDVYSVLLAFEVVDPGLQHAIKKLLCAGLRGKADRAQDLREARDAELRADPDYDAPQPPPTYEVDRSHFTALQIAGLMAGNGVDVEVRGGSIVITGGPACTVLGIEVYQTSTDEAGHGEVTRWGSR